MAPESTEPQPASTSDDSNTHTHTHTQREREIEAPRESSDMLSVKPPVPAPDIRLSSGLAKPVDKRSVPAPDPAADGRSGSDVIQIEERVVYIAS